MQRRARGRGLSPALGAVAVAALIVGALAAHSEPNAGPEAQQPVAETSDVRLSATMADAFRRFDQSVSPLAAGDRRRLRIEGRLARDAIVRDDLREASALLSGIDTSVNQMRVDERVGDVDVAAILAVLGDMEDEIAQRYGTR